MKVSVAWLKELMQFPDSISTMEMAEKLTLAGLEVEGLTSIGRGLSGAIVVEVRGKRPHPQADKLNLVDVFDGKVVTQVVCGANNVPEGGSRTQVIWAKPGATLPSGMVLGTREVRGIASPGMLCSTAELGLTDQAEGLLLLHPEDGFLTGQEFVKHAGLPDEVLEVNVTPNRPDCLGHVGIAREVAALFWDEGARLNPKKPDLRSHFGDFTTADFVSVDVQANRECPRYQAILIQGIRVKQSPLHLRLRLDRLGLRPINNVVDATQLAMLEWGQPLHAFDLDKIGKKGTQIQVRKAGAGSSIELLDGTTRILTPEDLVIANGKVPIALAGIMGSKNSQVDETTKNVLLESAYFDPTTIRKTAKRLKLQTDASYRFERGVDPNEGVASAAERCVEIITNTAGGMVAKSAMDIYPKKRQSISVELSSQRTNEVLGTTISAEQQEMLLTHLGMKVEQKDKPSKWKVLVPTYRPDVTREIDLIEEIGRLYGYNKIEGTLPPMSMPQENPQAEQEAKRYQAAEQARDLCVSLGFVEIQTLPFTSAKKLETLRVQGHRANPFILHNPMREEASALRTQLCLGLLEAVRLNHSHGQKKIRLFEVAEVFLQGSETHEEQTRVAGVLAGMQDGWMKETGEVDFFDLKGAVDILIQELYGTDLEIQAAEKNEISWLHPGVSGKLVRKNDPKKEIIGELGEIHPDVRKILGIETPVFAFEFDVPSSLPKPSFFTPWARFNTVDRDLSFFVDEEIPVADILRILQNAKEPLLLDITVLEDYREAGHVPVGKKGLLLSLRYRSLDRTLRDEEVQFVHERIVEYLKQHLVIELR